MRMSYGIYEKNEVEYGMKGNTLRELRKERTALKRAGLHGEITILDRCTCGCGGAHPDKNIRVEKF